jgi:hypothetical protein
MAHAARDNGVSTRALHTALKLDAVPRPSRGRPRSTTPPNPRDDLVRRRDRLAQAKRRSSTSYKTEAENLGLLLLWEAGELSEGLVAKALDMGLVQVRKLRDEAKNKASKLALALLPAI